MYDMIKKGIIYDIKNFKIMRNSMKEDNNIEIFFNKNSIFKEKFEENLDFPCDFK